MKTKTTAILLTTLLTLAALAGCLTPDAPPVPVAASGAKKADADIQVGSDGLTVEQRNIKTRIELENKPGSIKHLYIISAMSGQTILYSTVAGKVTSSGKRLTPTTVEGVAGCGPDYSVCPGWAFTVNGKTAYTREMLQDDGTYGSSIEYVYWFDVRGAYHQHYISGGQIVHLSDQPIAVKDIIINIEAMAASS